MIYSYLMGFIPLVVIFTLMPYITRKDNFFGVSAPTSFYKDIAAKKMRMLYSAIIIALGIIFVGFLLYAINTFNGSKQAYISTALLSGMIVCWSILYLLMHNKAKKLKEELGWKEKTNATVVADTSFYTKKIAASKLWFVLYAVIIVITLALGFCFYGDMPDEVLIRTNSDGSVEYAQKSFSILLIMPGTQLFISLVFAFVYCSLKKARPELSADAVKETVVQNAKHRYAWSLFTVLCGALMVLLFGLIQLEFLGILSNIAYIGSIIMVTIIILSVVALSIIFGQSGSKVKVGSGEKSSDIVNRDDDRYWKMGMFYVNKNDPSLFIEKRFGIGYTVNFARPGAWIFIAVIIGVAIVSLSLGR